MTDALGILSIGPPPERHADRVVAAMLRQLAQTRAHLFPAICAALQSSSDGTPQAQRKLERRIKEAGALSTLLTPGKRGRYTLHFCDCTGWDPARNVETRRSRHAAATTMARLPRQPDQERCRWTARIHTHWRAFSICHPSLSQPRRATGRRPDSRAPVDRGRVHHEDRDDFLKQNRLADGTNGAARRVARATRG